MRLSCFVSMAVACCTVVGASADDVPSSPNNTLSDIDVPASTTSAAVSESGKAEYALFPVNGSDDKAIASTEKNIQSITELPEIFSIRETWANNSLSFWLVNVTDTQLEEIKKDKGIDGVEKNYIAMQGVGVLQLPTEASHLPDQQPYKEKRALEYTTQSKPYSDLVFISQPT